MKKLISLFAAVLLLTAFTVTASAAGGISATNALGKAGQTVMITVRLDETIKGDSMLVEYSFDDDYLSAQHTQSQWLVDGVIKDFHDPKIMKIGAWAAEEIMELQGDVCSLAFLVKPNASFDTTKVSCSLTVMLEGKEVAKYSTTAQVVTSCTHNYGMWENKDLFSHNKVCTICGDTQSGVHAWDDGKIVPDPENQNNSLAVYTCTICRGTRSVVLEDVQTPATEPEETQPEQSQPSNPSNPSRPSTGNQDAPSDPFGQATEPYDHNTHQTDPFTGEPVGDHADHQQETKPFTDYNEPDHTHPETTVPLFIEHDHDHTTVSPDSDATPIVIVVAVAVLVGALVFFVKKKW